MDGYRRNKQVRVLRAYLQQILVRNEECAFLGHRRAIVAVGQILGQQDHRVQRGIADQLDETPHHVRIKTLPQGRGRHAGCTHENLRHQPVDDGLQAQPAATAGTAIAEEMDVAIDFAQRGMGHEAKAS